MSIQPKLPLGIIPYLGDAEKQAIRLVDQSWCRRITEYELKISAAALPCFHRFLQLPAVIRQRVIAFIPKPDMCVLSKTCKLESRFGSGDIPSAYKTQLEDRNSIRFPLLHEEFRSLRETFDYFGLTLTSLSRILRAYFSDGKMTNQELQDSIAFLPKVTVVDLFHCDALTKITALANLTLLAKLEIKTCSQIDDFQSLAQFSGLKVLNIQNCHQVEDLSPLSNLTKLEELIISYCPKISKLEPVKQLASLQHLDITKTQISDLSPLAELVSLKSLGINDCSQVQPSEFTYLTGLSRLVALNTDVELTDVAIESLTTCSKLEELNLSKANNVTDVGFSRFAQIKPLCWLTVHKGSKIPNLTALKECRALIALELEVRNVKSLEPFSNLVRLKVLSLFVHPDMAESELLYLKKLPIENLEINIGMGNVGLRQIAKMQHLQKLTLSNCKRSEDAGLMALTGNENLRALRLKQLTQITDEGLLHLTGISSLRHLMFSGCEQITDTGLMHLTKLVHLKSLSVGPGHRFSKKGLDSFRESRPNVRLADRQPG